MAKAQKKKPTPRRSKKKVKDPEKEEETRKRVVSIEGKRQKVIEEVKRSLYQRRMDKIAIEKSRVDKEEKFRQKVIRDAAKTGSERTMLEVSETNYVDCQ